MKALKHVVRHAVYLTATACAVALFVSALAVPARAVLPPPTPEIDPGSLASALALVAGGVLVLRGRVRR
jgi:hypothetical protein